jgi:type II secretory ATPase GspE/PulE/Tfp pilus assembly ATPase PilB-like protein
VVAQRLARKLCVECKKEQPLTDFEKKLMGAKYSTLSKAYKAAGCDKCNHTGYKGRVVISEVLPFDRELDELVSAAARRKEMLEYLLSKGFVTMAEDGLQKVAAGITDLKELMRVVDMTDRMG